MTINKLRIWSKTCKVNNFDCSLADELKFAEAHRRRIKNWLRAGFEAFIAIVDEIVLRRKLRQNMKIFFLLHQINVWFDHRHGAAWSDSSINMVRRLVIKCVCDCEQKHECEVQITYAFAVITLLYLFVHGENACLFNEWITRLFRCAFICCVGMSVSTWSIVLVMICSHPIRRIYIFSTMFVCMIVWSIAHVAMRRS